MLTKMKNSGSRKRIPASIWVDGTVDVKTARCRKLSRNPANAATVARMTRHRGYFGLYTEVLVTRAGPVVLTPTTTAGATASTSTEHVLGGEQRQTVRVRRPLICDSGTRMR